MAELVLEAPGFAPGLHPVGPAAHLARRFADAEVTGARGVSLREVPFLTMIGIRVAPGSDAAARIEARSGVSLPDAVGAIGTGDDAVALWQAPDEFLLVSARPASDLLPGLVEALGDDPGAVVDMSANRTTLELAGPSARSVLEKGCALDLHPRAFAAGTAYLTVYGSVPVILWKVADESYRLLPRSSFADFLGRRLLDAMTEFAGPELP